MEGLTGGSSARSGGERSGGADPSQEYDTTCENAIAATGLYAAAIARFDSASGTFTHVGWASRHQTVINFAVAAVRTVWRGFDPLSTGFSVDGSAAFRRVFRDRQPFAGSVTEAFAGSMPGVPGGTIGTLGGFRFCYIIPIVVETGVFGALMFYADEEIPLSTRQVCLAFARQVTLTLDNARLLDEARQARAEFEAIFDATDDGAAVFAADGTFVRMNAAAQRIMADFEISPFATTVEAAAGFNSRNPAPEATDDNLFARAFAGESGSVLRAVTDRAGRQRHLSFHVTPIFGTDASGARIVRGAIAITHDVTDLHVAISEQARLDGAIKTARAVTHQLNNKLAITVGYASLLTENTPTEECARQAQRVLLGAQEAAATVRQLQRLIRFEEVSHTSGVTMLDIDASTRAEDDN